MVADCVLVWSSIKYSTMGWKRGRWRLFESVVSGGVQGESHFDRGFQRTFSECRVFRWALLSCRLMRSKCGDGDKLLIVRTAYGDTGRHTGTALDDDCQSAALNSDAPATHDICSRIIHVFMCFYFSRKSLTLDAVVLQQLYLFRSEKHWHCLLGLW